MFQLGSKTVPLTGTASYFYYNNCGSVSLRVIGHLKSIVGQTQDEARSLCHAIERPNSKLLFVSKFTFFVGSEGCVDGRAVGGGSVKST